MLTREGFNLVVAAFLLTFLTSTVIIYPPLTLSTFAVTVFTLSYILIVVKDIRSVRASDFVFSRSISTNKPKPREKFEVKVSVTNRSARTLELSVIDGFEGLQLVEGVAIVEKSVEPNESIELRYVVMAPDRGVYVLGPLVVKVSDDYGICCKYITLEKEVKILVRPQLMEKPRLMESVRRVRALSISGSGSSVRYGADDTFREITKHEEGQPLKSIDWRRTARDDCEIYVRKYDRLNRLNVLFLLDCTVSNMVGNPPLMNSVFSAVASSSLAMLEKGDMVTLKTLGAAEPMTYTAKSKLDFERLMGLLTLINPGIGFDIVKEAESVKGFDAVFLIGRLALVDGLQIKEVEEEVRRRGGVLFTVIPLLNSETEMERILAELEILRVNALKKYAGFITAVKQHELPHYIAYLHKMLKVVA